MDIKHKRFYALIALAVLSFMAASNVGAETKKSPVNQKSVMPWTPEPFPSTSVLPPHYSALDAKRVLELFNEKSKELRKGEFETSVEYARRLGAVPESIGPLKTSGIYAFQLSGVTVKYDADSQSYRITDFSFCQSAYDFGETKGWVTCTISDVERKVSEYVGTNSYGASASITRIYGADLAIAVRADSRFFSSGIFEPDLIGVRRSFYNLDLSLPVPVARARAVSKDDASVLLVGRFSSAKTIDGPARIHEPTVSEPSDVVISVVGVPFEPVSLIYYVVSTGEILGVKEL